MEHYSFLGYEKIDADKVLECLKKSGAFKNKESKPKDGIGKIKLNDVEYSYEETIRALLDSSAAIRSDILDMRHSDSDELRKTVLAVAEIDRNIIALLGLLRDCGGDKEYEAWEETDKKTKNALKEL